MRTESGVEAERVQKKNKIVEMNAAAVFQTMSRRREPEPRENPDPYKPKGRAPSNVRELSE